MVVFKRSTGWLDRLMLMECPIGMGHGRTAGHNSTAACEFIPFLRDMGHRGMYLQVVLLDGCLLYALEILLHGRRVLT